MNRLKKFSLGVLVVLCLLTPILPWEAGAQVLKSGTFPKIATDQVYGQVVSPSLWIVKIQRGETLIIEGKGSIEPLGFMKFGSWSQNQGRMETQLSPGFYLIRVDIGFWAIANCSYPARQEVRYQWYLLCGNSA